jgi:hypothetical protein
LPYEERPISAAGKERIAAAMRDYWKRVKSGEVVRPPRKKNAPAAIVAPPKPEPKPVVLTPEDIAFAKATWMLKPKSD